MVILTLACALHLCFVPKFVSLSSPCPPAWRPVGLRAGHWIGKWPWTRLPLPVEGEGSLASQVFFG